MDFMKNSWIYLFSAYLAYRTFFFVEDYRRKISRRGGYSMKNQKPDHITIHHTATSEDASIQYISDIHENEWGRGIEYHYVIRKGRIYKVNDPMLHTYHNKGINSRSIGIAFVGDYVSKNPSPYEMILGRNLILNLRLRYGIKSVEGHKKNRETLCPGSINVNYLRSWI